MRAPPLESVAPAPGSSFRFLDRRESRLRYNLHRHGLWELNIHTRGAGTAWVGDHAGPYRAPCAFLVGPDLPHTWASDPGAPAPQACLVLQFPAELPAALAALPEWRALEPLLRLARRGALVAGGPAVAAAGRLAGFASASGAARLAMLVDVLAILAADGGEPLSSPRPLPAGGGRFDALCRHLHAEVARPHSLAGLGRRMGMHPQALARAFRRHTGHSVIGYLQRLRIARACELLRGSDRTISACAAEAGFPSLAHFNRVFRRLHASTPRAWRSGRG